VRCLKQHIAHRDRPIALAAQGQFTVVAQCAAAISPEINRIYLSGGLATFESVAATEIYNHAFANFVPGFLNSIDLPEVTAFMEDRRVTLAGMVDGAARPLDAVAVRRAYKAIRNLEVLPGAGWTAEAIAKFANA
ncbi:MAG: hypothetical protein B7X34_00535, partial [Acidobacteriia bacterium 12-62-4]